MSQQHNFERRFCEAITAAELLGADDSVLAAVSGGADSVAPSVAGPGLTDDDTVDASASTLPLIVFGGLGDDDLLWPPARPVHRQAARRAALAGADGPERVFQNCPGKHVGMLCAGGDREVGRMAPLEEVSG